MNFLKKLFSKKQKSEEIPEKKNECWYNNAHELGEAARNSSALESGGSNHSHENADTQFVASR